MRTRMRYRVSQLKPTKIWRESTTSSLSWQGRLRKSGSTTLGIGMYTFSSRLYHSAIKRARNAPKYDARQPVFSSKEVSSTTETQMGCQSYAWQGKTRIRYSPRATMVPREGISAATSPSRAFGKRFGGLPYGKMW